MEADKRLKQILTSITLVGQELGVFAAGVLRGPEGRRRLLGGRSTRANAGDSTWSLFLPL